MKRTTKNTTQPNPEQIRVFSELLSRASLAARLGMSFDGSRDIYEALGWKTKLQAVDYATQYSRQDIAKAIINRPVEATWRGEVAIVESGDDRETALEREWKKLMHDSDLKLKNKLIRLDKLSSLGEYGVLYLGLDDVVVKEKAREPVQGGSRKLLFVRPLSQTSAAVKEWEIDPKNKRFGLPKIYELTFKEPGASKTYVMQVHFSRVLHLVSEPLESDSEGEPVLKAVFNRLTDLEKLVGGSAEMFWRGARPGYAGKIDPDFNLDQDTEDKLREQIDEYEHNLRRVLVNQGVNLESLAMQIADPSSHVDIQIQMISACTGIPKRILVGSERGELASSQDEQAWKELIQTRREEYAEVSLLRPLIKILVEYGVLPKPVEEYYGIGWMDLFASSEKEKAEVGKIRADALKAYASAPGADLLFPPEAFFEHMMGFSQDQIDLIKEMVEQAIREEEAAIAAGEIDEQGINEEDEEEIDEEPEEPNKKK